MLYLPMDSSYKKKTDRFIVQELQIPVDDETFCQLHKIIKKRRMFQLFVNSIEQNHQCIALLVITVLFMPNKIKLRTRFLHVQHADRYVQYMVQRLTYYVNYQN